MHPRWMHWAQNTAERHRANGQKSVFLTQHPEFANLSQRELIRIVNEQGDEFQQLLGGMQVFNANLNGSNAYLFQKKQDLETLMEAKQPCTL